MKAVITVVINDEDGLNVQKLCEAKTMKGLRSVIKGELPKLLKKFHAVNHFLEEEDDKYIADLVEDFMDDKTLVYAPSSYQGSGFVQVKYF